MSIVSKDSATAEQAKVAMEVKNALDAKNVGDIGITDN